MIETKALSPASGVEVTGVEDLLDDESQLGDLVVWDNTGILHRALPYDPSSRRTRHRTTIAGDEAWS